MKSFAERRQEMIDGAREREREPEHSACSDYPETCLAVASEIGNLRAILGKPYPVAFLRDGDGGDDYEDLRREYARSIPAGELTRRSRKLAA